MLLGGRGGDGEGGGAPYTGGMQSAPRSASQRVNPPAAQGGGDSDPFDPGIGDDDVPF
jgi:hypothetical protein